jgi:hypothetical protein
MYLLSKVLICTENVRHVVKETIDFECAKAVLDNLMLSPCVDGDVIIESYYVEKDELPIEEQ